MSEIKSVQCANFTATLGETFRFIFAYYIPYFQIEYKSFLLIAGLYLCSYSPWPGVIKADRSGGDPRTESVAERGENSEA